MLCSHHEKCLCNLSLLWFADSLRTAGITWVHFGWLEARKDLTWVYFGWLEEGRISCIWGHDSCPPMCTLHPALPLKQLLPAKPLNLFSLQRLLCESKLRDWTCKTQAQPNNTSSSTLSHVATCQSWLANQSSSGVPLTCVTALKTVFNAKKRIWYLCHVKGLSKCMYTLFAKPSSASFSSNFLLNAVNAIH